MTEGELEGRLVAVVVSGVGRASARRGAEHLTSGHRPRVLVSAGFAGALDPDLKRNDLVAPRTVLDGSGDAVAIDEALVANLPDAVKPGRLLLVDRVITDPAEKAALRHAHQADLIDMETFAVAALRAISAFRSHPSAWSATTLRPSFPPRSAGCSTHRAATASARPCARLWSRPSSLKDFWALHSQAMESADRLATDSNC